MQPPDAPAFEAVLPRPRAILVGAAARGLVFALPAAVFAAWWSTVRLGTPGPTAPPPPDLLATLFAALQGGVPVGACAAASAAVELGWPRRGQRSDFTAALIAFVAGVAAAALASLQVDYARGVLVGGRIGGPAAGDAT